MRHQTSLRKIDSLLKKPFFTSKEASIFGVSAAVLGHYVKTGKIKRIRRGVYQDADYKNADAFLWYDLVEAVHSIPGGVVCLISALSIYELTEEMPRQHWIGIRQGTSAKRKKQIKVVRFRNIELGKTEIELEGMRIPIFDKERTIIDAFRLLSIETAIKALKMAVKKKQEDRLDLLKIEEYAKKLRFNIAPYLLSVTT
jgi:predicted transcriptional regulator of viral defense system